MYALAALASASVFAQSSVTLGGTYNFGLQKSTTGAKSADFFDAKVNLSGKEDLGGGLTAAFFTEIQVGGRQDTTTRQELGTASGQTTSVGNQSKTSGVWGRNATLSLAGGFGSVTGGRIEGSNVAQKAQLAGASLANGFDQADLAGANSNYNMVGYVSPAINGFTANVAVLKSLNADFAPAVTATDKQLSVTAVGFDYAAGPLAVGYVNKSINKADTTADDGTKNEAYATYDLGMAKVGYGYSKNSGARYAGQAATNIFSVAVPMGALTVGADYATRSKGGSAAAADSAGTTVGKSKGYALAANYALSKRTKINATVGKLTLDGVAGESQYRVGLFHNF